MCFSSLSPSVAFGNLPGKVIKNNPEKSAKIAALGLAGASPKITRAVAKTTSPIMYNNPRRTVKLLSPGTTSEQKGMIKRNLQGFGINTKNL